MQSGSAGAQQAEAAGERNVDPDAPPIPAKAATDAAQQSPEPKG